MSVSIQHLLPNTRFHHHNCFFSTHIHTNPLKPPLSVSPKHIPIPFQFQFLGHTKPIPTLRLPLKALQSDGFPQPQSQNDFDLDAFLSVAEVLCLAPSTVLSIGCVVNWVFLGRWFQVSVMNRVFVCQVGLLVGAVVIGGLIRRRQWKRICVDSVNSGGGGSRFNLVERIEKVEEDLRSSATIIRVLSRQVEKLGIRFRVTRKTLKEPISETAALAQKNSEATRTLAIQEDILEKELGEIQKVLLAMQEQQQKQLELILAVMKAGKLRDVMREPAAAPAPAKEIIGVSKPVAEKDEAKRMETQAQARIRRNTSNDKA